MAGDTGKRDPEMSLVKTRCALWLGILLAMAWAGPGRAEDRALVIGIERYADPRIPTLPGCEDDAHEVALLLEQGFEMKQNQIRLLLSHNATLENILAGLEDWVVGGTHPGDRVILYYSGHGSQAADDNGDEADGMDEILCPYDCNASTQANVLRDDRLHEILTELRGRNVTIIFDACHCGTAYKSIGDRIYSDPVYPTENVIAKFIPPPQQVRSRGNDGGRRTQTRALPTPSAGSMIDEVNRNEVVFSACQDGQRAEIGAFVENRAVVRRSVFTRAFLKGLSGQADRDFDGQVLNSELIGFINADLREFTQTPQLKCTNLYANQLVFGRTLTLSGPARLFYTQDHEVAINRGAYHGVKKDDRFLLKTNTQSPADVVDIQVERVDSFLSFGRIDKDIRFVPPGPEVQPMVRPRPFHKLHVFFAAFTSPSGGALETPPSLREAVAANPELQIEPDQAACDRMVAGTLAQDGTLHLFIYGRFGRLQSQFSEPQATAPAELVKRLKAQVLLERLAAIQNPVSPFRVDLRVKGGRNRFLIHPKGDPRREKIELLVKTDRDCHLVLLTVDSQGQVTLLLPNRWQPSSRLSAGREYQVPPPDADFVFPIKLPPGHDVITAVATLKPFDLRGVTAKGLQKDGFIQFEPGNQDNLIEDIYTRGIGIEAPSGPADAPAELWLNEVPSAADWATATLTVETVLPNARP